MSITFNSSSIASSFVTMGASTSSPSRTSDYHTHRSHMRSKLTLSLPPRPVSPPETSSSSPASSNDTSSSSSPLLAASLKTSPCKPSPPPTSLRVLASSSTLSPPRRPCLRRTSSSSLSLLLGRNLSDPSNPPSSSPTQRKVHFTLPANHREDHPKICPCSGSFRARLENFLETCKAQEKELLGWKQQPDENSTCSDTDQVVGNDTETSPPHTSPTETRDQEKGQIPQPNPDTNNEEAEWWQLPTSEAEADYRWELISADSDSDEESDEEEYHAGGEVSDHEDGVDDHNGWDSSDSRGSDDVAVMREGEDEDVDEVGVGGGFC